MSYDISLYDPGFLKRAVEQELRDWTGADAIASTALAALITAAENAGFVRVEQEAELLTFMAEEGAEAGEEWLLDGGEVFAELSVFRGQIAFSIPSSSTAKASIELCARLARDVARAQGLGYYDPQLGIAEYG